MTEPIRLHVKQLHVVEGRLRANVVDDPVRHTNQRVSRRVNALCP
ncbi:hypothetical protein [Mycobacterium uberis]|nr:hypothetical protein [Mycobacterium uberis]